MKLIFFCALFFITHSSLAKVAFQKERQNQRLIVVAENDGSNQQVISDLSMDTYHPDMSSSGRYVAYSRGTIQPGKTVNVELVIKDLENPLVEVWTPQGNQYIHAEFSGNDRYLVFSGYNSANSKQNIMLVDLIAERAKGAKREKMVNGVRTLYYEPDYEIIESAYDCYAPAVSSDGSFVVYHRTADKSNKKSPKQLVLFNRGDKSEEALTDKAKHAMFPSLSANDQYLAYVSKDNGQWDIYVRDLWKKTTHAVTNDANVEFTPVFSSQGDLYFTRFESDDFNNPLIDIYMIPEDMVFDSSVKAIPQAFLNEKDEAEYVVSFSNFYDLKMEKQRDLLSPERSSFGSVFHNGKTYIAGGHQGPEHTYPEDSFLDVLEVYDESTKTWTSLASMKTPKHGFQMAAYGNYLYVFGGFAFSAEHKPGWKSLNSIERYNIKNNVWEILPIQLKTPRSSNALGVIDNKVYLIGGWDSTPKSEGDKEGKFLGDIEIFDLETEKLVSTSLTMPQPLRRAFTAVVKDKEIYLLGGIGEGSSHFEWIDNVTVFNPQAQSFREESPLPFATFAPGAGVLNGDIYLMGGMVLKDKATYDLDYVDDIYRFDGSLKQWSHSGVYLEKNKGFPQVISLPGDRLGILGGHTYEKTSTGYVDHPVKSFEILKTQ